MNKQLSSDNRPYSPVTLSPGRCLCGCMLTLVTYNDTFIFTPAPHTVINLSLNIETRVNIENSKQLPNCGIQLPTFAP